MSGFLNRIIGFLKDLYPSSPQVRYSNEGREGYVWYVSRETTFSMYFGFGGGDCIACINIPADWEKETGLPLERRDEVLRFIGERVVRDQVSGSGGYYKIEGDSLNIYSSR